MTENIKARVLFVDDEPRVLTTMRMLFRSHYEVHIADSGAKALDFLRNNAVDVIVSDQRMPGMTGIEMLRTARDLNPNAMRILLTGYSDLNAIIGSINEGEIFRFVNKPWSNEELTATVARAVTAARNSAAAAATPEEEPAAPVSKGTGPGVLVLDDDVKVPPQIQAILGPDFRVVGATNMDDAVGLLESEHIGVVISDTMINDNPVLNLISTLKQHHPELVSVILTNRADAGTAIDLINQGQIYRFITKPLQDSQCKITVGSALRQHNRLAQSPELHQRYEVAPTAAPPSDDAQNGKLMDRIRDLRGVVKRWV